MTALGRIAGAGHIHCKPQVRIHAVGRGGCAAQAHFFLRAEDKIQLVRRGFDLAQGLDHHRHADAVIHGL